jgi:hypothetical protein
VQGDGFSISIYVIGGITITGSATFDQLDVYVHFAGQPPGRRRRQHFTVLIFFIRSFLFFV